MTSFAEKYCGSCLTLWLIVDTLLISRLFASFVRIFSQFLLYICYLGEFVWTKTHIFQCFSAYDVTIERVYKKYRDQWKMESPKTVIVLIFTWIFEEKDKISWTFPFVVEVARPWVNFWEKRGKQNRTFRFLFSDAFNMYIVNNMIGSSFFFLLPCLKQHLQFASWNLSQAELARWTVTGQILVLVLLLRTRLLRYSDTGSWSQLLFHWVRSVYELLSCTTKTRTYWEVPIHNWEIPIHNWGSSSKVLFILHCS